MKLRSFSMFLSALMFVSGFANALDIQTFRGKVSFKKQPTTIVAFPAGVIDTLDALGINITGLPEDLFLNYINTDGITTVGTLFTADIEKIHKIQPDVVIIGERSALQYESLSDIAPIIDLSIPRGNTFQASINRMHSLAKLFDKEKKQMRLKRSSMNCEIKPKVLLVQMTQLW